MTAKRCGWAPVEGLTRLEGFQEPWEKVHPHQDWSQAALLLHQLDIQPRNCVDGSMLAVQLHPLTRHNPLRTCIHITPCCAAS